MGERENVYLRERRPLGFPAYSLVLSAALVRVGDLEKHLPFAGVCSEEATRVVDEEGGARNRPGVGAGEHVVGRERCAEPVVVELLRREGRQPKVSTKSLELEVEENDRAVAGSLCKLRRYSISCCDMDVV